MHLGLVTHNVISGDGQGRVNVELARHLLDRGAQVTLIANQVDDSLLDRGANWISIDVGPLSEVVDLIKVWRFQKQADRLLRRIGDQFDAVLACGVVCSVPHTLNAVHFAHGGWLRSPYHASKVNPGLNGAYQWLFSVLNDRWERQTLAQAERIVAVSQMVKEELISSGFPASKIEVIVNGVDCSEFQPGPADRAALGLPEDVPLALFVGDIRSSIKNPDGVLQALADARDVHLALAGSLDGSPLPDLARELDITDRVHFLGFRRDIAALMRAADFFVLPSRRDSCPLVLLEALASGLPSIVSSNVGTADLVADGAGFVIDEPNDHSRIARHMQLLSQDSALRRTLARKARSVAQNHSWDRMASQYVRLLCE